MSSTSAGASRAAQVLGGFDGLSDFGVDPEAFFAAFSKAISSSGDKGFLKRVLKPTAEACLGLSARREVDMPLEGKRAQIVVPEIKMSYGQMKRALEVLGCVPVERKDDLFERALKKYHGYRFIDLTKQHWPGSFPAYRGGTIAIAEVGECDYCEGTDAFLISLYYPGGHISGPHD